MRTVSRPFFVAVEFGIAGCLDGKRKNVGVCKAVKGLFEDP